MSEKDVPQDNNPTPGWYPDPLDDSQLRRWTGSEWSEETKPNVDILVEEELFVDENNIEFVSPPPPPPPPMPVSRNVNFLEAIKYGFLGYSKWNGRATRSEFWWWVLALVIFGFVANIFSLLVDSFLTLGILTALVFIIMQIVLFIPTLSLSVRRLHDVGKKAWYAVVTAILPFVFWGAFIVLLITLLATGVEDGLAAGITFLIGFFVVGVGVFAWNIYMIVLWASPTKNITTPWDNGYRPSINR
jgi:uncharacterized membrane protein YhaH (DUF805 family)